MRKTKGFTLVELLVVMIIMSVLVAAIHPMLAGSSARSRELTCSSNLKRVGMALNVYSEDYTALPAHLDSVDPILQDRSLLHCPNLSTDYHYRIPAASGSPNASLASCIDPTIAGSPMPHGLGGTYLELRANGTVCKKSKLTAR